MGPLKRFIITVLIGVLLLSFFYVVTNAITKFTGYSISGESSLDDDFRDCLDSKDIQLYINSKESYETLKKIYLYSYLSNVKIMNCEKNIDYCIIKGIDTFPTWVINGEKIEKDLSMIEFSSYSGCKGV
jgi:hypothetical protein